MEVTQPGPFKEAWYHDFAPPIHSLDRHGDFAPPLLALALAAGFFGVGTGGNGLQYHSAKVYGPHNIGDWLDVQTTSFTEDDSVPNISQGGMIFKDFGVGIVLTSGGNPPGYPHQPVWSLSSAQMIYYLAGKQDIGYTQGGNMIRFLGGGSFSFYTTEGSLPGAGDFNVFTNGASDSDVGNILLDASGVLNDGSVSVLAGADIEVLAQNADDAVTNFNPTILIKTVNGDLIFSNNSGGGTAEIGLAGRDWQGYLDGGNEIVYTGKGAGGLTGPGGHFLRITQGGFAQFDLSRSGHDGGDFLVGTGGNITLDASGGNGSGSATISTGTNDLTLNAGGNTVHNIETSGATYVVKDHLGSPLVTYTG